MGHLILEHEGTLERFTGDGMMIFFNDPLPVPNPGERAVRMAVAMRESRGGAHGEVAEARLRAGLRRRDRAGLRFVGTVDEIVTAEPAGELTPKGFARAVPAFNIVGLKSRGRRAERPATSPERSAPRPARRDAASRLR